MSENPAIRMSDAEREAVVERLSRAAGEGRLSLDEFEQRVAEVLAARTFADVEPYVADLPAAPAADGTVELRATVAGLKRAGAWVVGRRLTVRARAGTVKLDFTEAVIADPVVEIELDTVASRTTLVLPPRATVDVAGVAGNCQVHGVPLAPVPGRDRHFVVRGVQKAGELHVRRQRGLGDWRW
jgi:uncharacterized protein DUF1707